MQTPIDAKWVEQINKGDTAAFKNLFNTYCQALINFARRYVKDTQIAENIVQDVFVKIWEMRSELNPSLNIKVYLYTMVKNHSLKYIRHLDVQHRSEPYIEKLQPAVQTPEEEAQGKELSQAINEAIEKLPEKERLIFSMNRFDHLTYKEIAEIQDLSVKTVETYMGRALRFLRERLVEFL
jgi:RNA polymerase sigma-70 factor (ECF subfamily)